MGAIPSGKGGEHFHILVCLDGSGMVGARRSTASRAAADPGWSSGRGGGGTEREGEGEGACAGPRHWPCRAV